VATTPQDNSDECHIIVYFTADEGAELFSSIATFAQTFQGQMTIDAAYDTDDQFRFWISEWEGPTQSMSVTEMQYLDGTPLAAPFEGMVVAIRRVH